MFRQSGYPLSSYGRMLAEGPRSNAYIEALRRTVVPGCTVLEIGTGPGFFALLAAQLGASKVFAVEADPSALEAARLCAEGNNRSERVEWIEGLSTDIDLPGRVDVVLADLRGCLPTYNHNIDSIIDARRRHLKPGGTLIPRRDVLRVAPVQSTNEYSRTFKVWSEPTLGIDLGAARRFVVNEWWRTEIDPEQLLAPAADIAVIDYGAAENSEVRGTVEFEVDRPGLLHGWLLWFDADLADGASFTNGPDSPLLVYGRAFLPVERPLNVAASDCLTFGFMSKTVTGREVNRWSTTFTPLSGSSVHYDQSTFKSRPLAMDSLARMSESHVPTLSEKGQVDLAALDLMRQSLSVREIAQRIATKFPGRFPKIADAVAHIASLSGAYSERLGSPTV